MGEITAAVPEANTSLRRPSFAAASTSSMASLRSDTLTPHLVSSFITESRVMPGSMVPEVRGAVITSPSITKKALEVPISSTYLCSTASSQRTSLQEYSYALREARMPPA